MSCIIVSNRAIIDTRFTGSGEAAPILSFVNMTFVINNDYI